MARLSTSSSQLFTCALWAFLCINTQMIFQCSGHKIPPLLRFGTITAYQWSHPVDKSEVVEDILYERNDLPSCRAVHAGAVIRHGERLPEQTEVQDLLKLHSKLVSAMNSSSPIDAPNEAIFKWENKYRIGAKYDQALTLLGRYEMKQLGSRLALKLKSLFNKADEKRFDFYSTSKARNLDSADEFYNGFHDVSHISSKTLRDTVEGDIQVRDDLLRFYSSCKLYQKEVIKNPETLQQYTDFKNGPDVEKLRKKIAKQLNVGFDNVTAGDVQLMYFMCAFEMEIFNTTTWCSVFPSRGDIKVMEYLDDIKGYYKYKSGPVHPITGEQSCPLISKMFRTMDDVISQLEKGKHSHILGQFGFGHVATLGTVYAALRIFNEAIPLTASSYSSNFHYHYRLNKIIPFSANIVFVLYDCSPENSTSFRYADGIDDDYQISLMVNEEFVALPGCKTKRCSYKIVRDMYKDLIDNCNIDHICNRGSRSPNGLPILMWMVVICITSLRLYK